MAEGAHLLQLPAQLQNLLLHHLFVFDGLQDDLEAGKVDGFGDVVLGADFERLDRGVDRGVSGQNDHGNVGIGLLDAMKEIEAGPVGKLEVDDGDVGNELADRGSSRP